MLVSFLPVPENNFIVKVYYVKGLSINDVSIFFRFVLFADISYYVHV